MQKTIQEYVVKNWEKLGLPGVVPGRISTLQISRSHGKEYRWGRIAHLLFTEGSSSPAVAAMFCRDKTCEESFERESGILKELARHDFGGNLPRLLDMPRLAGRLVMLQEAAAGMPMSTVAGNARYRLDDTGLRDLVSGHFTRAAAFLKALQGMTPSKPPATDSPAKELDSIASMYCGMLKAKGAEEYIVYGLARAAGAVLEKRARACVVHGDFVPSNIFLDDGGGLKVIDWEFSKTSHLGFLDAMRFIFYYFDVLREHGVFTVDGYYDTFTKRNTWFFDIAMNFINEVDAGLVEGDDDFGTLFGIFLLHDAVLQVDVSGGAEYCDLGLSREMINQLTGLHSLKERENLKENIKKLNARIISMSVETGSHISELNDMVGRYKIELDSVHNSKSWRLTRPLRAVTGLLKGTKPKG
jgi:serine/threonine protein kinase